MDKLSGMALDFSAVKSFEPVPGDIYEAVFDGGKVRRNRADDGDVFNAEFTIENAEDSDLNGRKVFRGFSLKPQALWALKEMLLACDTPEDEFTEDADLEDLVKQAEGAHVLVTVTLEPNTNKPGRFYNNVTDIKSAS